MIRIVIVEDDPTFRYWLTELLKRSPELHCSGEFGSFEEAQEEIAQARVDADVLLLDLKLPGMDGREAARLVKDKWPLLKVLVLSFQEDPEQILTAVSTGIDGYIFKGASRDDLADAIARVYRGEKYICPKVSRVLFTQYQNRQALVPHLSPTEKKILDLSERGRSYKQMCEELNIRSMNTLRTHIKSILVKFGAFKLGEVAYLRKQLV